MTTSAHPQSLADSEPCFAAFLINSRRYILDGVQHMSWDCWTALFYRLSILINETLMEMLLAETQALASQFSKSTEATKSRRPLLPVTPAHRQKHVHHILSPEMEASWHGVKQGVLTQATCLYPLMARYALYKSWFLELPFALYATPSQCPRCSTQINKICALDLQYNTCNITRVRMGNTHKTCTNVLL